MLIEPSFVAMLGGTLISSSLLTSAAVNTDKTYKYDKESEKISMIGGAIGFGGLIITILMLMYNKIYFTNKHFKIGVFGFLWVVLVALTLLSVLSYEQLDKGYHYPLAAKHTLNKTERGSLFAAFCISLICVTVGLCFVFTHGIESEFFDDITGGVLNIKELFSGFFDPIKRERKTETAEMDNFLNDLKID